MKIAILGYGLQGESAYRYWNSTENELTVCDQDESLRLPDNVTKRLGPDYLKNLDEFDLLVRSPKLHPRDIVTANSSEILAKVTTNTNEFFRVCPSRNIVGVTGTKGKGTTSTLITKMLEASGQAVHLGGNIGMPPLDMLKENIRPDDWVVLELANFQLIDLRYSPHIAVCLMVVPEHLDWHTDMAEYIEAKQQMFVHQKSDDLAIYFSENENSKKVAEDGVGQKIPYFAEPGATVESGEIKIDDQAICKTDELKLLGQHNWQNVCAAVTAVWQVTQNVKAMKKVLTSFSGLEHRLEFVREVDGVKFYNDSFAATPDAAMAAMDSITGPKIVILGGFDRNLVLGHLFQKLIEKSLELKKVIFIGASSERLAKESRVSGFSNFIIEPGKTMPEIVNHAKALAESGDSVVLSPGFPSFDMFKNFEERGQLYKKTVEAL